MYSQEISQLKEQLRHRENQVVDLRQRNAALKADFERLRSVIEDLKPMIAAAIEQVKELQEDTKLLKEKALKQNP